MVNPETAAADTTPKGTEQGSTEASDTIGKSVFLEKVSDIPVVNVAKEYGTAAYNHVKQMNRFANFTLNKAESTLLYFALSAKPFLEKVQPQAKIVDDMACRTLEAVEVKAPFIMMTPEQLVEEARKLCSSTLGTGINKVEEIKTMGTDAVSSVKNYGMQKANDYLSGTEDLVEKYLPPAFGEGSAAPPESTSLSERATQLTTKVTRRVYGHGVKHFISMQKLSEESITKLVYTVELLQHIKENYAGKTMQEYVDEAKVKANWIWDELNKEPAQSAEADKSLEQRLLSLARRITSTLVHTYSSASVPLTGLPQTCLDGVRAASTYAAELFTQFDQATKTGEVASAILQKTRSTISLLEAVVRNMVENAQSKAKENIEMQDLSDKKEEESAQAT